MNKILLFAVLLIPAAASAGASDPTAFALDLNRRVADGGNVMTSGYSARQAMGLALIGAAGKTRAEMEAALRAGPDFAEAERVMRGILAGADGGEATLKIANALFIKKDYAVLPRWESAVKQDFAAAVFRREFGAEAVAEINSWASKSTNGRIPKIIDKLGEHDRAVLLNAVYFKGKWVHAFPKERTEGKRRGGSSGGPMPETFHLAGGKTYEEKLMSVHEGFDYTETAQWQAVRLPYKGNKLAMIVVLPSESSDLAKLRAGMDSAAWKALRAGLDHRRGLVAMPKFTFENSTNLVGPLKAMGMNLAFDQWKSDFSGISKPKKKGEELYITQVVQKTFVKVDEEGTEAAAVTAGIAAARGSARQEPPPFRFVANRPFFFAIEDVAHGNMLFAGEVHDPRK